MVLRDLGYMLPPDVGQLHGASLRTTQFMRWVLGDEWFAKLEVFVPPGLMTRMDLLRRAADWMLPESSRGKGRLSFYPYHHLAEVWKDGVPRVVRSTDPEFMARDRYLRDKFAEAPSVLSVDTHLTALPEAWPALHRVLASPVAPYDGLQMLSTSMARVYRRWLDDQGHSTPFRLDVVPRPVDPLRFRPSTADEKRAARDRFGLPADAVIAIYHSRVGPYGKADLEPLLKALAASPLNIHLAVSGTETSPNAYQNLARFARDCGVGERVHALGFCAEEDVSARLAVADFFVLPGDHCYEALGTAVIEALACGLPCLVTDWDGLCEGIQDGVNGFLVPTTWVPGAQRLSEFSPVNLFGPETLLVAQCIVVDQAALSERFNQLASDTDLRVRMSNAARASAAAFSPGRIEVALRQVFEHQLKEADAEPQANRVARRAAADALGLPTNYDRLLSLQATHVLSNQALLSLTEQGRRWLAGETGLALYDEPAVVVPSETIRAVAARLLDGPAKFAEFGSSITRLAVACLMKKGLVQYAYNGKED